MKKKTIFLSLISIPVCIVIIFLLYVTLTDYVPAEREPLTETAANDSQNATLSAGTTLTAVTFNLGYAGLDQDQDFFMDGGSNSRSSSKAKTEENITALGSFLQKQEADFVLLQEVDVKSSRSFKVNEVDALRSQLPQLHSAFAYNYKVPWVPVPVFKPMGSVQSGLLTMSAFQAQSHTRFDLPGKESWPVQQMELDRAFVESRYKVDNDKELVLLNLHLSAFDDGGKIRKQQLDYLENYIAEETRANNYLLIGGDWNHSLPGTDPASFPAKQPWPEWLQPFPDSFGPADFKWAADALTPSVRTLDVAYEEGLNFLAVIDGFFVSPNIEITAVNGVNLQFANSDHNPVLLTFCLL